MVARILTAWDIDASVAIGCAALLAGYVVAHRSDLSRAGFFVAGVAVMFVALASPLDKLADSYLFSAHMLQHMLFVLVVPPLLVLGLTERFARAAVGVRILGAIERGLRRPVVAWLVAMVALWAWHAPALYNAALASEDIHIAEHLCFMVTAAIFWWPILSPLAGSRMPAPEALLYLVAGMLATGLLGILLTFARPGLYPTYLDPHDSLGILPLLRDSWGITPATDQELGGLLMWVPGGLVFLAASLFVLARWYRGSEAEFAPGTVN